MAVVTTMGQGARSGTSEWADIGSTSENPVLEPETDPELDTGTESQKSDTFLDRIKNACQHDPHFLR